MAANAASTNNVVFGILVFNIWFFLPSNFLIDQNDSTISSNANTSTLSDHGQVSVNNNASTSKSMYFIFKFKYFLMTLYLSAKPTFHTRQQKQSKPCNIFLPKIPKKLSIIPSQTVLSTPHPNHSIDVAASNNQTTVGHVDIRGIARAGFVDSVQRWTNGIKDICDARKQQLWYELFGDESVCASFFQ